MAENNTHERVQIHVPSYQDLLNIFQNKPFFLWIVIGLIGLGFLLLLSGNDRGISNNPNPSINYNSNQEIEVSAVGTRRQLESELARTLSAIAGVGQVRVELNLKSGNRKIWERQLNVSKRVTQEQGTVNTEESNNDQLVIAKGQDGRDAPILKEELAPEIQGVIVVASGAVDSRIKQLLISTVMTLLNLPAHRVMVIAGANEEGETK
jgi:stage III sporulation protein AG